MEDHISLLEDDVLKDVDVIVIDVLQDVDATVKTFSFVIGWRTIFPRDENYYIAESRQTECQLQEE